MGANAGNFRLEPVSTTCPTDKRFVSDKVTAMKVRKPMSLGFVAAAMMALVCRSALPAASDPPSFDAPLSAAAEFQARGVVGKSIGLLNQVLAQARAANDAPRQALALSALSDAYLLTRSLAKALQFAEQSVDLARRTGSSVVFATALNQLANVEAARQNYRIALDAYDKAVLLAEQSQDQSLAVKVQINLIHVHLAMDRARDAFALLRPALDGTRSLAVNRDRLFALIGLGYLAQQLQEKLPDQNDALAQCAMAAFTDAWSLAEKLSDARAKAYVSGHLAELHAAAKRYQEAERLIHRALFFAEAADAPEVSARWYRQLGQLRSKQGFREQAIAAYSRALDRLQGIQPALVFGLRGYPGAFRETVGRIYLELAELLLDKAETTQDKDVQQQALRQIRAVMEDFKAVELRNHFRDYCVTAQQEKNRGLELDSLIKPGTVTFYPVVFRNRIVLLLAFATGEITYTTVSVSAEQLRQTAERLRRQMHPSSNPRRLLRTAQTLYNWLIKPIESELNSQGIDTLVVVPDDVLRTIPFAVLHDGRDFLITRYAVAVTPGLMLTDPSDFSGAKQRLLVNGLSEGVQGFDGLPYVNAEVAGITSIYGGKELLNEGFVKDEVIKELQRAPYSVVSFSTHGYFDSNPDKSFVLTYDDKLSLDELERFIRISEFREQPLEMIVLSACDTAIGDDRAALGLAGVAVKAGAKSAMASLWAVNDQSTAELVPTFFAKLKESRLTKAQALQQAQQQLLADSRTKHPYYWGAFILIGNWF